MRLSGLFVLMSAFVLPAAAHAACAPGAYGPGNSDFVAVVSLETIPPPGQRYLFRDGRRGSTADADSPVRCVGGAARVRDGSAAVDWPRLEMNETPVTFPGLRANLAGSLVEPAGPPDPERPLVVMVHGSERTAAIGNVYSYALAAQGLSVFVYDKRGTGASEGLYTQNFELLAEDAAAALRQARAMAEGRFGRAGFFGGSQGGWVAPLAATRIPADFVAVGFGLVTSPIGEDREQMIQEARAAGFDETVVADLERVSAATARIVTSHFADGLDELEALRREFAGRPWIERIQGEYSMEMLRARDADLRRLGRPLVDNVELIWDYESMPVLRRLDAPLLWVLAGEDREAPIDDTRAALAELAAEGRRVEAYLFPDTDHGMIEFTVEADGSRRYTRITDGYLRLLADWIRGDVRGPYGRAERLH